MAASRARRMVAPVLQGHCVVTDTVALEGHRIRIMYRDQPEDPRDSGWRFTAGFESLEYVDDPNNCGLFDLAAIAGQDPTIIPFLDAPPGSAFQRDDATGSFEPIRLVFADEN